MKDCLFCKIANGEIPSEIYYQDDFLLAFKDVNPVAPTHFLVIPRKHIGSMNEMKSEFEIAGKLLCKISELAELMGLHENGYRVLTNTGKHGGQSVAHLHFHVLGGRHLAWPPG